MSKIASTFFGSSLTAKAQINAQNEPWAADAVRRIAETAQPWLAMPDETLWSLMFGHTLPRSWMVWSDGHCPSCTTRVPMYSWEIDALNRPWKVRCPHCREIFPKNDFEAFYHSGLDEHGVFDPSKADRSLLFNPDHPNPADPLHLFGVDDGTGYTDGKNRWRFIAAYLVYGQWMQLVYGGIKALADAYVVTRDTRYAHKAGVLLDRVADLYPSFDYAAEGFVYENLNSHHQGYVSVWHNACEETREMVLAYDKVFEALRDDQDLARFLSDKAKRFGLQNPKRSFADIQANIEAGLLLDPQKNPQKVHSNYPQTPITLTLIKLILGWPENRDSVLADLDTMLEEATAVDGVTGEKGLTGYANYAVYSLATFFGYLDRLDPGLLPELFHRHPSLHQTFRFHLDTWCFEKYAPQAGDTGFFASTVTEYPGVRLNTKPSTAPSGFTFLRRIHELTGDPRFLQVAFKANNYSLENLPYDLFDDNPTSFRRTVEQTIAQHGRTLETPSVDKKQWHLAILRSGRGPNARALWIDYDSGGRHAHCDGMNVGLFAKGLDLIPDFGYPPVHHGGWGSLKAHWYITAPSHNTVVVDGMRFPPGWNALLAGRTTLWAEEGSFHALSVSGPNLIQGQQYERTLALTDVSETDFYVLDIFRVVGGTDHAKFFHSHFGAVMAHGLNLSPGQDYGHDTMMRNFRTDPNPQTPWSVDWTIEDRYHLLPPGTSVRLRYTDLTTAAQASLAEAWVTAGAYDSVDEVWIPRLMVRRQSTTPPLASTFVSIIEPYETNPLITNVRRLPLLAANGAACPDSNVALEIQLANGRRDILASIDSEGPFTQPDLNLQFPKRLHCRRLSPDGKIERFDI